MVFSVKNEFFINIAFSTLAVIMDPLIETIVSFSDLKPFQAEDVLDRMKEQTDGTITQITNLTEYFLASYKCYVVEADVRYSDATLSRKFFVNACLVRSSEKSS